MHHDYNHAKHSSTHRSPFETFFGFIAKSPLDFVFGKDIVVDAHSDGGQSNQVHSTNPGNSPGSTRIARKNSSQVQERT